MRLEAFAHVRALAQGGQGVSYEQLSQGFVFEGERVRLLTKAAGIFKPKQMEHVLSICTRVPKPGRKIWYNDQREVRKVHQKIYAGDEAISYEFTKGGPGHYKNQWLKNAFDLQIPVIYFVGVSPSVYDPHIVFITGWDPEQLCVQVDFSASESLDLGLGPELLESRDDRQYAVRQFKQRLHQMTFREMVLEAYGSRCAISGLPEPRLLDAAHIVADSDKALGQPVIGNGILLSKIHHSAFDQNLIGIDPDFQIHVSKRLLEQQDGETLAAIKVVHERTLLLPKRHEDRPSRERLEQRFEQYKAVN